jgi:nicotinamidase-related amidase
VKTALIIIDLQEGSFTPRTARHDTAGLVDRLNGLAGAVRSAGGSVIFVQHDGPIGDPHHPDQPGWQLLPELAVRDGDLLVRKTACDSFLNTTLDATLKSHEIERLIVTGCATDYCVDTTVRSALARGYATIVPKDGHTTADRPHLSARQIIDHHNAIWADFIAPGGPAIICACADVPVSG